MGRTAVELEEGTSVCVRHPERATRLRCQRCSDPICTECMTPAPVGFHCANCVAESTTQLKKLGVLPLTAPFLTYILIAANVAVGLASLLEGDWVSGRAGPLAVDYGILGGGVDFENGTFKLIGIDNGEWYRVFTGAFLHGGLIHLGFNMLALWQVGLILEPRLGRSRFGMLCLVSLIGGSFGGLLLAPGTLGVGASGLVFGLMGALFVAERQGLLGAGRSSVGFFIAINLALTFAIPGISIGGHIGGLAAGAAAGWLLQEFQRRKLPPTLPMSVLGAASCVLFLGCLWASSFWMDPLF